MAMDMLWTALMASSLVFAMIIVMNSFMVKSNKKRLPPGPRGIPILGHLHLLGKNPHQDLAKLAKKHGDIMYMRFGFVPVIVVSSPQAAEKFLKTHDLVFASRPSLAASKIISYEQRNFVFAQYGPYWRSVRKLCTLQLLTNVKISSFQAMRMEEVSLLIDLVKVAAAAKDDGGSSSSNVVDISAKVSTLNADMTCRMLFGKKYSDEDLGDERGFRDVMQELMEVVAAPNLADFFPLVGAFDIQGLARRCKAISKVFDAFFEKIIEEHEESSVKQFGEEETKDFVHTLLEIMRSQQAEFQIDRRHIKALLLDMLSAAMDTSATVIEWTFSELLRNPGAMRKVQEELDEVVGRKKMVDESCLDKLEYLHAVVKESLRIHPVAPLLLPHEAMEDCVVNGFHIPKKSRVIVNIWPIGRDPSIWEDAEEFLPERFIGNNIDLHGRDFQFIPFGAGRRSCPGMQLGLITVHLVVAQLAHCFDWKLPYDMKPGDLDMTEHFGIVMARANHLMAIPTYRLQI